jgi:ferrous iron transport protein A
VSAIHPSLQASSESEDVFTLDHFQVGQLGRITEIDADTDLKQRLAALGLREGFTVRVLRKASFGGPMHVRVGTTEVIMRRIEAKRLVAVPMVDLMASPFTEDSRP